MSLIGRLPASDQSYPIETLMCLEGTKEWLDGNDKNSSNGANGLFRVLENMRCREKFQPSYSSNESEPEILGGRLEFREPIWVIIHEVVLKHNFGQRWSASESATWLQTLLDRVARYRKFEVHLKDFKSKLSMDKIPLNVDLLEEDQNVRLGKEAVEFVFKIVEELIPKIKSHIENK